MDKMRKQVPNPDRIMQHMYKLTSFTRKQCCKRRMKSLICRCVLSYQGVILRIRVPLFASDCPYGIRG